MSQTLTQTTTLLSVRQAAKESGVSYKMLLSAVLLGQVKSVRLCKRRLISVASLESFVQQVNRPAQIQEGGVEACF
jgi:hypothetical protein